MSGHGSGAHTWPRTCPVCGGIYTLTNFMKRKRRGSGDGNLWGWYVTDTHVMACLRATGRDPWENVHSRGPRIGDPIVEPH